MLSEKREATAEDAKSQNGKRITIRRYDFRNVRKLNQNQRIRLGAMHSRMAALLAKRMEKLLNCEVEASFLGLEQVQGSNFKPADFPDSLTVTYAVQNAKENIYSVWPREIAFLVIERMLGGTGDSLFADKPLSEFERNILIRFGNQLSLAFKESFEDRTPPDASCAAITEGMEPIGESRPYEVLLMSRINIHIKSHQGVLIMIYPYSMARPWIEDSDEAEAAEEAQTSGNTKEGLVNSLAKAPVMISVKIGAIPLKVSDFNNLQEGDCIQLNHSVNDPFNIYVENQLKYHGYMGSIGNQIGIKISEKLISPPTNEVPRAKE